MPRTSLCAFALLLLTSAAIGQVVATVEIKDPELRALQGRYMDDLKQLGADILAVPTEYPFYLSRRLDLDQQRQKGGDQRSIRFDRYEGKTVLEITGNYYAAYSTEKMSPDQRARATFLNVVVPILKAAVPRFQNNANVQAYALEISHHVVGKVMGVAVERPENLVVVLPQQAAIRLIGGKDETTQQAALMQGKMFLNAQPVSIWLNGEGPQLAAQGGSDPPPDPAPATSATVEVAHPAEDPGVAPALKPKSLKPVAPPTPARDTSPVAIAGVDAANKDIVSRMVKELDAQAHFVPYAAPNFFAFRGGIYLELSINTTLNEPTGGSRYRMAALAFDDHVSHLVRPAVGYFKEDGTQFDGIAFSTSLHPESKAGAKASSEAVEFFFPFSALRCYERYDCSGQQLLDAGTVLINGERVSLDLQVAEGGH